MKTFKLTIFFLLLSAVFFSQATAQSITGSIMAKDEHGHHESLAGVNIQWLGTTIGTSTDANGEFKLSTKGIKQPILVVSFLGYKTDTIDVKGKKNIKIEMLESTSELGSVEITSRVNSSFISEVDPRKVQVITSHELKRAACCNLSESFETNSSVDVMYADAISGAKQIQMLGLSGVYSQIISENVPLLRGLGSTFGLSYIPGPWMESISVAKGAGSVRNGFESTTGLINVEYKKPANSEKFYLNGFINHHGRLEANVNAATKFNKRLSTMVLGHASTFQRPFDNNDDNFMDIPKSTNYNFINRWDYEIPGKYDSRFLIKYMDEKRVGGFMDFNPETYSPDIEKISNLTETYGFQVNTKRLESFWKNGLVFKNEQSVALIISGLYHRQNGFFGINEYDGSQKGLYGNLIYDGNFFDNEKHHFNMGLNLMYDDYKENYFRRDFTFLYQVLGVKDVTLPNDTLLTVHHYSDTNYIFDRKEIVPGAYFEYTWAPIHDLTIIGGIRIDHHNTYGMFYTPRLHMRYKLKEKTTFRASAGKGYRTANILSENFSLMASQRTIHIVEKLEQEQAWNYGINITHNFTLFSRDAQLDLEAYRTSFENQIVADLDSIPSEVYFYNLKGESYANSLMAQLTFEPIERLSVMAAYGISDVKTTINNELRRKPMVNAYKGIISLAYSTKFEKWKFDITLQLNGKARIPDTKKMPSFLQRAEYSPSYAQMLAQVTRKFKHIEIYLGGENLTNYTQKDPITEAFAPYHTHFDTSMVWGPLVGATVYAGFRYVIK